MDYATVLIPNGPTIIRHKGWKKPFNKDDKTNPALGLVLHPHDTTGIVRSSIADTSNIRQFPFVNASISTRGHDSNTRKLIKRHVQKANVRESRANKRTGSIDKRKAPLPVIASEFGFFVNRVGIDAVDTINLATSPSLVPDLLGFASALTTFEYPFEMQPRCHTLLSRYLQHVASSMYPLPSYLSSNPITSPTWFRYAVADPAMLHAMLYAGAIYLALLSGRTSSQDAIYHLSHTIEIVNRRLTAHAFIDDYTIGALSCIALGEAVTGNLDLWHLHMNGLKQIVDTRGTLQSLNSLLQIKLRRTDITGAIDYAAIPYFHFERHWETRPPIWHKISAGDLVHVRTTARRILRGCKLHYHLVEIMVYLACFAGAVQKAREGLTALLDPAAFSEDLYWLEYKLLSFPATLTATGSEGEVDKATRLGALLYLKAILEEYPHSSVGSSNLLEQIKDTLQGARDIVTQEPIIVFTCLVGGSLCKMDDETLWFKRRICLATRSSGPSPDVLTLGKIYFLQDILGSSYEAVWPTAEERRWLFGHEG